MNYSFEKVVDGIAKYLDRNLYHNMNDIQELIARVALGRVIDRSEDIKDALIKNGILKTFGIINSEGEIDVEGLANDLKNQMQHKGGIELSIPLFGKIKFVPEDIDDIHRFIREA